MTSPVPRNALLFCSLSVACVLSLWFVAVPDIISQSTFAFLSVFIVGAATASLMTVQSAQPDGSVGQLLYATESAPSGKPAPQAMAAPSAWDAWQLRGVTLDKVGQQRIFAVLLTAILLIVLFVSLA